MKALLSFLWHIPRNVLAGVVFVYQKILSPDHSFWAKALYPQGYCKFYPSCSEYSRQAFKGYGVFRGFAKSFSRVVRCNPWSEGGVDKP